MLRLEQVSVFYGSFQVLWDVGLSIDKGSVVCVLGPNGAGKSTLLKAIAGLVPCRGRIFLRDEDISRLSTPQRIASGIGIVLERRRLFAALSVRENLDLGGYQLARSERLAAREKVLALLPVVKDLLDRRAGDLSGGQQQLVAIGRGLMAEPELLLLDEPYLGLSPRAVDEITDIILMLRDQGLTIIFNEQNVKLSLSMSHQACLLESGRLAAFGPAEEIGASAIVQDVYFGTARNGEAAPC